MAHIKSQKALFFITCVICLVSFSESLFAEYKITDAMQQFGEKRFLAPKPARLRLGPLRVHPTFRSQVEYDSNIFLENHDSREDVIFDIVPGGIIEIPFDTHQITVGYEADREIFSKARHADQTEWNQYFFSLIDLRFPNWYVNVLEKFAATSSRAGTTFTTRIPRYDQTVNPKIGYRWGRTTLEAGYNCFLRQFRRSTDDQRTFNLNEWSGVVYYDLFARLKLLLEDKISRIEYPDNFQRNGRFNSLLVGFEGELWPRLITRLRTGWEYRKYDETFKEGFNSWVGVFDAQYQWRERTKIRFSMERAPIEATFGNVNYFTRHIFRLGFDYLMGFRWTYFQDHKVYLDHYAERTTLNAETKFRHDTTLAIATGFRYRLLEWMSLELAYEFARRGSNYTTFSYTDNRVSLMTTVDY
ncbi:MAG: outer membrane beta-barrel protein [Candidatus Omnitrophica bacterium]|nr:outer membrane beta-barrel protein [Candidatus Omnitrophota bacterium]